jgi:putative oxidoreductase
MKLKDCLQVPSQSTFASVALLLLRLAVGVAFMMHGWGKIQTPFGWLPEQAPMAIPGFLQFLAAFSEFAGGLALAIGLLTPIACLGLAVTMAVATFFHAVIMGDPFVNMTGGGAYELALIFMLISIVFTAVGPGKYSVDAKVFGFRR